MQLRFGMPCPTMKGNKNQINDNGRKTMNKVSAVRCRQVPIAAQNSNVGYAIGSDPGDLPC